MTDMRSFANKLLGDVAAAQTGVRYEHIPCYLCHGFGTRAHDTIGGGEWDERCTACNGKGTIVLERPL